MLEVDIEFAGRSLLVQISTSNFFFFAFYTHNTPKRTHSPSLLSFVRDPILLTPVMPQRLLDEYTVVVVVNFFLFFYKAKSVHRFLSTCENAPVVNILVTSKRKVKYLSSRLAQNKHKFEQKGLNRKR